MAAGWQAISSAPGIQQNQVSLPVGDARTWNIAVPGKDLTGHDAQWLLGTPPDAVRFGLLSQGYTTPGISVLKAAGANLAIIVTGSGSSVVSNLRFTLTYADTISLPPRSYWQQAVAIDPMGNPVTVAQGDVILTPSLRALQVDAASAQALSPVVRVNFAIWRGDNTPPQVWSFGTPGNLVSLTGSTFLLAVEGLQGASSTFTARSDASDGVLVVNTTTQTVTFNYSSAFSASVPTTGAPYQLYRLINGTSQLWTHGNIVGLAP